MSTFVSRPLPDLLKHTIMIPDVIYHYTSPEGLIGIITRSELWFSRFDCLNDADEGEYIKGVYRQAVAELKDTYERAFLEAIKNYEPNYHRYYRIKNSPVMKTENSALYRVMPVGTIPYICCFSENDDSLPMWNYYSKNGQYEGYNIGFRFKDMPHGEEIDILKCVYNEHDQIEILKHHIGTAYENYRRNDKRIEYANNYLISALSTEAIRFKNPAYKHEEEVRMTYWVPEKNDAVEAPVPNIYYRQTHGIIIPYIRKDIDLQACYECVRIGPMIKSKVAKVTACELLISKGIVPIIEESAIPIRY